MKASNSTGPFTVFFEFTHSIFIRLVSENLNEIIFSIQMGGETLTQSTSWIKTCTCRQSRQREYINSLWLLYWLLNASVSCPQLPRRHAIQLGRAAFIFHLCVFHLDFESLSSHYTFVIRYDTQRTSILCAYVLTTARVHRMQSTKIEMELLCVFVAIQRRWWIC